MCQKQNFIIFYSQGVAAKQGKFSSVKRLLVIGAVPDASENYFNVKAMLDKVDMEAFEFTVSADLKMCKLFLEFKVAALEKIYFE